MNADYRPHPDDLLNEIKRASDKQSRGKLKIFFGMCPGVGKTFAMLKSAQEKSQSGIHVLVGLIETHQRADTEKLLAGLEILPRRIFDYRGTSLAEFDLDRALELHPELILVDELAHSNAAGSRHQKRYLDIKELLSAGINVYTTLNVQHLESRAEQVFQISGVPVRETVPDSFLELADQIELIDLSPEDLLRRLKEGKVYLGDRADRAAQNFFKLERLTALREMALRFTAQMVDDQLRDQMQTKRILGPWNTQERLMVALSHSPYSARLIRSTRRMAYTLEAPWVALYVDTGTELTISDQETLTRNLNLARELGGEVITTQDRSISDALRRIAGEKNVTQIVMGRPDRRPWRDFFGRGNLLDQIVNETSEVDIHVIRQRRRPIYRGFRVRGLSKTSGARAYAKTFAYIACLALLGYPLQKAVGYRAIGFGFLLGILPISGFAGLGPMIFGAGLTAVLWDFLFIPPIFAFEVREPEDVMMIIAYFSVASVAGLLASRVKRQEADLLRRERRANILYAFAKKLSETDSDAAIAQHGAASIETLFASNVAVLRSDFEEKLERHPLNPVSLEITEKDFAVASWSYDHQKKAGWRTETLSASRCLVMPLQGRSRRVGVLMLYPKETRPLTIDQENLIETVSGQLAAALERESLATSSRKAELYERSEKLHQALLNTVSHELRTPLTSIMGGVTTLVHPPVGQSREAQLKIADGLLHSVERLNHTVQNLMDMSRISSGALKLKTEIFELNDFLRSMLQREFKLADSHPILTQWTDENLFIRGDERILEHVLQNLIRNAIQYSPVHSPITVQTRRNQTFAEFSILDEGPGLAESEIPKIFERFYRPPGSPPGGVGLGLAITKAMVEAHGGAVFASNRRDLKSKNPESTGACFTVILPITEIPDGVLE